MRLLALIAAGPLEAESVGGVGHRPLWQSSALSA